MLGAEDETRKMFYFTNDMQDIFDWLSQDLVMNRWLNMQLFYPRDKENKIY